MFCKSQLFALTENSGKKREKNVAKEIKKKLEKELIFEIES